MGGTQSSNVSSEAQERLERLYLSVTDFIVRNTDMKDMINIVSPDECGKYTLYLENIMRRSLNTMPLHTVLPNPNNTPLTPENNLVYLSRQYIDTVRPDINNLQGDKKNEFCKNVANFFIKIMRVYAAIYLAINDNINPKLIDRKVYDSSVSEFDLKNPFSKCLANSKFQAKYPVTAAQSHYKLDWKIFDRLIDIWNVWKRTVETTEKTASIKRDTKPPNMSKQRRDLLMETGSAGVEFPLCTKKTSPENGVTTLTPNFSLLMGKTVKIKNIPGFEEILLLSESINTQDIRTKSRQNIVKMFNVFARQMEKTSAGNPTLNVNTSSSTKMSDGDKIGDKDYNVTPYLEAICSTFSDNARSIKGNINPGNNQIVLSSPINSNSGLRNLVGKIKVIVDEMEELNRRNRINMQTHLAKLFMTGEEYMKIASKTKDFPYVCPFNLKQFHATNITGEKGGDVGRVVESLADLHFVKKGAKKNASGKYALADFVPNPHFTLEINTQKAKVIVDGTIDSKKMEANWQEAKKKAVDGSELICIHTDLVKGGISYLDALILNVQTDLVTYYINVENKFRQGVALYSQIPSLVR
jgi:hypothetical protein